MSHVLTYKQTSEVLGLPLGTLYSMVSKGQIPHFRMGGRLVRFSREEIENWLREKHICCKGGL